MLKKKKSTSDDFSDLFSLSFLGEFVEIILKAFEQYHFEGDEGSSTQMLPMRTNGFILGKDDLYYYLGENPDEVKRSVRIDEVVHIEIVEPENQLEQILDEMPAPPKGQEN